MAKQTTYSSKSRLSKYVRINDYCLAEYIYYYGNNSDTVLDEPEENHFLFLENRIGGVNQVYNSNSDYFDDTTGVGVTKNIKNNLAVRFDKNNVCKYEEKNDILIFREDSLLESWAAGDEKSTFGVYMDTIRFHFLTGYLLSSHDALILGMKVKENNGKYNYLLSSYLTHANYDELVTFNPTPVFILDEKYDRYVEFKVPSVQYINNLYYYDNKKTIGNSLSSSGFVKDTPLIITFDECNSTSLVKTESNTYTFYNIDNHIEASITQYNEYESLSATIKEADDGNYFLYGLESSDDSISSWFNKLSSDGDKWSLIHQINVYEHLGNGETVPSDTVTIYQSSDFDKLGKYRPVIEYASSCVMITMDYMCRIMNESTGEQIIRVSGTGTRNVRRYGKDTVAINGIHQAKPYKIYNRIYKAANSSTELFEEPSFDDTETTSNVYSEVSTVRVEYPVYVDRNKINVTDRIITSQSLSDEFIVYNQYDLWLLLDKMENSLSFTIYKAESGNLVPYDLSDNETGLSYRIVFNIDDTFDITIDAAKTNATALKNGEIIFNVTSEESKQILVSSSNDFYIVSYNYSTMKNSVLYKGFWVPSTKYDEYNEHVSAIRSAYNEKYENATRLDQLSESIANPLEEIPGDVYIPGYVDQSGKDETSPMRS